MSKRAFRKYILPAASLLLLFYILWSVAWPYVLKTQIESMLAQYGFEQAVVKDVKLYRNMAVFHDIALAPEQSSTIGTITTHYNLPDLFSDSGFEKITIDDMTLYGEVSDQYNIHIAGWSGFHSQEDFSQNHYAGIIELNSAKLDLLTAAGGIRLNARGKVNVAPDSDKTILLDLWGEQYQLALNTQWKGRITRNGAVTFDIDIRDLRLRLEDLNAARIQGWATIEAPVKNGKNAVDNIIAGQLTIGGISINSLGFNEATLTFDKKGAEMTIITDAVIAGYENMTAALEINSKAQTHYFSGTYTASTIEDFMTFTDQLHENLQVTNYIPESYKKIPLGILAMEQTRKDVREIIEKNEYNMIEFSIAGPAETPGGKITARYRDKEKPGRHVIRLLPPPPPTPAAGMP